MSVSAMLRRVEGRHYVGSVLHGAYGDYYEQMVALRYLKQARPDLRLAVYFATESRRREMSVFDLSFADEVHSADALAESNVDCFVQFQAQDRELRDDVLAPLPASVLTKFDLETKLKPWQCLRTIYRKAQRLCDIPLGDEGRRRLPQCLRDNELDESIFTDRLTVGFLWRYRGAGDYIRPVLQSSEAVVRQTKSELFRTLIADHNAHIVIGGMNVRVTDENRERTDCKYTDQRLDLPDDRCTYLKGLNWGLELEIMRRCDVCVVMPSGFSEALLMKRAAPTVLVDAPPVYVAKLLYNRMPLYDLFDPRELWFALRQPHTKDRVMRHLRLRGCLTDAPREAEAGRPGTLTAAAGRGA